MRRQQQCYQPHLNRALVTGNTGVGKESLISSLRTKDDKVSPNEGGMAMEYTYMKFKLDEDDDGVWLPVYVGLEAGVRRRPSTTL